MDRSILLIVKKFDRYRISTNQNKKDGRWNSKIYYAIYSKTNLTGNDIVTFRCISSQDRLSLFSKLLCLGIVHKEESISSLFSHQEGKMQSNLRILESIIRDYTPEIVHRDEIHVRRWFSFIRGARYDDSLKIIERKREWDGERSHPRDNQFSSAVRFSICIMFLLFEKFHWM